MRLTSGLCWATNTGAAGHRFMRVEAVFEVGIRDIEAPGRTIPVPLPGSGRS